MRAMKKKETVWKGCISLPPEMHAFLASRGRNRSAAITDLLGRSKEFKAYQKGKAK